MRAMTSRLSVLVLMASTVALGAPGGPVLTPDKLSTIPRNGNARVVAVVTAPSSTVASCRSYFRAAGTTGFYFVEMRKGEGGRYWALLPIPSDGTKAVEVRIVAKDSAGQESATAIMSAPVAEGFVRLNAEESKSASNLVIGLTEAGQTGVPVGFKCDGIVNLIAVNGELKPNDECRKTLAAATAAGAGVASAGWSTAAAVAGGSAVVVAAGAGLVIGNNSGFGPSVSPFRPK